MTLNLARRPFANLRPLRRLAIGLWALGGVAAAAALWLFAVYMSGSAEKRAELARLEEAGAAESRQIAGLEGELSRFDLTAQNREVAFINDRISERTFAWSALFDDLAEVLPWNVRIESLSPLSIAPARGTRAAAPIPAEKSFVLQFAGTAKDGEALLTFVDRLFAHPAFAEPNLEQERRQNGEELSFSLTVTYRPHGIATPEQVGPASSAPPPRAPGPGSIAELATAPPSATAATAAAGQRPVPDAAAAGAVRPPGGGAATTPSFGIAPHAAAAASEPPAAVGEDQGLQDSAPAVDPEASGARGWIGVAAGQGTTAEVPEPVEPQAPADSPLPLAPTMSSTPGIR